MLQVTEKGEVDGLITDQSEVGKQLIIFHAIEMLPAILPTCQDKNKIEKQKAIRRFQLIRLDRGPPWSRSSCPASLGI